MKVRASFSRATRRLTQLFIRRNSSPSIPNTSPISCQQTLFLDLERTVDVAEPEEVEHGDGARAPAPEGGVDTVEFQVVRLRGGMQFHLALELVQHDLLVGVEEAVGHDDVVGESEQRPALVIRE